MQGGGEEEGLFEGFCSFERITYTCTCVLANLYE